MRVKIKRAVVNDFAVVQPGEMGTLVAFDQDALNGTVLWVKLDVRHPDLEEWDNELEIRDDDDAGLSAWAHIEQVR